MSLASCTYSLGKRSWYKSQRSPYPWRHPGAVRTLLNLYERRSHKTTLKSLEEALVSLRRWVSIGGNAVIASGSGERFAVTQLNLLSVATFPAYMIVWSRRNNYSRALLVFEKLQNILDQRATSDCWFWAVLLFITPSVDWVVSCVFDRLSDFSNQITQKHVAAIVLLVHWSR